MGLTLPIRSWGHGPVKALFLHGFGGNNRAFDHLEPLLGGVLSAVVPTLPGHNGVPLPSSLDRAGFLNVIEMLSRISSPGTVVIGYSQGARIGLTLACTAPNSLRALVMESGSPGIYRSKDRDARLKLDETRASKIEQTGIEAFMDAWEGLPMFEGLRRLPPEIRAGVRERRTGHDAAGLAGAFRALGTATQPSNWRYLPGLDLPVLIITGSRDRKFSRIGERMRKRLPNARHVSLRGVWHAPHLEDAAGYSAAIQTFLEQLPGT